jgi:hypothetical protein
VATLWVACQLAAAPALASEAPGAANRKALSGLPDNRIVAFADVHGGAAELRSLLEALGLIDAAGDWQGGRTRLVSLGDLLDRGPDSRQVMDLLMRLETEAAAAGGSMQLVLGNHEIMNLTGDLRYVSAAEYAAFAPDEDPAVRARAKAAFIERARAEAQRSATADGDTGVQVAEPGPEDPEAAFERRFPPGFFAHRAAFAPDGRYGRWLLSRPQILILDRIAFVHGGLSDAFVRTSIPDYNIRAGEELRALLDLGTALVAEGRLMPWQDLLTAAPASPDTALPDDFLALRHAFEFADDGPTWYRGTAACHPLIERPRFDAMLAAQPVDRVVMGHTPTFPRVVQTRFEGRAVLADTGMYEAYYHGRPSAVVFGAGEMRTLTLGKDGVLRAERSRPAVDVRAEGDEAILAALRRTLAGRAPPEDDGPLVLNAGGRRLLARYHSERRNVVQKRLAAQALDHLLGLGLVAPVVAREGSGNGTFEVMPAAAFSEAERVSAGRYRPNWCDGGSDYDLMYALDALLGMDTRSADNVHYDPATWLIYLTGQDVAFPTWRRLPRYLENRPVTLPPALAERLANLTAEQLEEALGEYLGDRQLHAVLGRRDRILSDWQVAE